MAYNDDTLKAKLATLNETQESIVSVAHWINFHRRYADRIAQMWLARLKEVPPPKRLNFIYLVNDIVQNARARKRPEFPNAFAPIIADAVQQSYRSATTDIQSKIKRVVDVWKNRGVFEENILNAVQGRIDEVDKARGGGGERKKLMGNSLFSSQSGPGMPKELETLAPLQTTVSKAELISKPLTESSQSEYINLVDNAKNSTSAPVHAANLSSLIKKLASAEASLNETITARKALVNDLKRLMNAAEEKLKQDEALSLSLSAKRTTAEISKRDVEDSIMRGLSEAPQQDDEDGTITARYDRPDVEELTPEPEAVPSVPVQDNIVTRSINLQGILAGFESSEGAVKHENEENIQIANSLVENNGTGPTSSKKRKLSHDIYGGQASAIPDLGEMDVGFDGTFDAAPYSPPAPVYASSSEPSTPDRYNPSAPQMPSMISTLEQDVDALIRGAQPQI